MDSPSSRPSGKGFRARLQLEEPGSPTSGRPPPSPSAVERRRQSTNPSASNVNVKVMVRVRPFSDAEIKIVQEQGQYMQSVIDMPRVDQVQMLDHERNYNPKQAFNFDTVLWSVPSSQQQSPIGFADQERVHLETGAIALDAAWEGINSCIFAYGQTGSGKTHTMMGNPASIAGDGGCSEDELGVIPRLCRQLFDEKAEREQSASLIGMSKSVEVELIFIEIYNEQVFDLLVGMEDVRSFVRDKHRFADRRKSEAPERDSRRQSAWTSDRRQSAFPEAAPERNVLQVREHPTEGPQVVGVTCCQPTSYKEIMQVINYGNKERHVAATKLNDRSSRSHAMFRITLRQLTHVERERAGIGSPRVDTSERRANINLVDLAGSENTKRSGVTGATMVEAQKINLSLTTLRRVIDALIEKKAGQPIPYRDSTLTWLLRQDLGGNSRCFMLATVSPHHCNAHESLRTLEYAMRARAIVNQVRVNEDDTARMLRDLEKRLEEKQRAMLTEEATEEQKAELQRELDHAKCDAEEVLHRIDSINRKRSEQMEVERELRHQKAKQTLRLAAKAARLQEAAQERSKKVAEQKSELDRIRKAAQDTGHTDVDDLAASLQMKRSEIEKMRLDTETMEQQYRAMQDRERELEQQHEQEKKDLLTTIQALLGNRGKDQEKAGDAVAALEVQKKNKVKELESMYEKRVKAAEDRHAANIDRQRAETQEQYVQLQKELEREHQRQIGMMQRQIDQTRREARDVREESGFKLRGVQDAETELRGQVAWTQREYEKSRADLRLISGMSTQDAAKIEARLHKQQELVAGLTKQLQELTESAQAAARQRDAEAKEWKEEFERGEELSGRVWEEMELATEAADANWTKYQKAGHLCGEFLDVLEPVDVHDMKDARNLVRTIARNRGTLKSVRPAVGAGNVTLDPPIIPGCGLPKLGVVVPPIPATQVQPQNGTGKEEETPAPTTPSSTMRRSAVARRSASKDRSRRRRPL
eukprot:TRINITY_DN241_c1_g1_i5.p1 TRINITY_DN241_c1_g1~~TRINITY_DN241_c1_g1_i5.p1  ORF type:complete len:988 (+),score=359.86 TRINITY_DN241_c1_g1_i5:82-3045(+)